jgi:hypothetical protein
MAVAPTHAIVNTICVPITKLLLEKRINYATYQAYNNAKEGDKSHNGAKQGDKREYKACNCVALALCPFDKCRYAKNKAC